MAQILNWVGVVLRADRTQQTPLTRLCDTSDQRRLTSTTTRFWKRDYKYTAPPELEVF